MEQIQSRKSSLSNLPGLFDKIPECDIPKASHEFVGQVMPTLLKKRHFGLLIIIDASFSNKNIQVLFKQAF